MKMMEWKPVKQNKAVRKRWEIDIHFGTFKIKEIRERLYSFRVRNIIYIFKPFERKRENM